MRIKVNIIKTIIIMSRYDSVGGGNARKLFSHRQIKTREEDEEETDENSSFTAN